MQPNKENLRAWVAALRSGEFSQGRGRLARANELYKGGFAYCCLGVACEVAVRAGVDIAVSLQEEHDGLTKIFGNQWLMLPPLVRDWLGLDSMSPRVAKRHWDLSTEEELTALNDDYGWSFASIADAIEAHYGLLETEESDDAE